MKDVCFKNMNRHDKCPLSEPSDRNATHKALPMLFFWLFRKLPFTPIQWRNTVSLCMYMLWVGRQSIGALEVAQLIAGNIKYSLYKMHSDENDLARV